MGTQISMETTPIFIETLTTQMSIEANGYRAVYRNLWVHDAYRDIWVHRWQ